LKCLCKSEGEESEDSGGMSGVVGEVGRNEVKKIL
jgi:hypothetical protein